MPKLYYYGDKISANMTRTPEGYLICQNVPIARVGSMAYAAGELGVAGVAADRMVTVYRQSAEVFDPAALASFEGKPVTDNHPPVDVEPANYSLYEKGHVQNVRKGEGSLAGYVVADLHVKDPALIAEIESHQKREISCGYACLYESLPNGTIVQRQIRGNHVAVVAEGRAGSAVSIKDSRAGVSGLGVRGSGGTIALVQTPNPESRFPNPAQNDTPLRQKGRLRMRNTTESKLSAFLRLFARGVRDAKTSDELDEMTEDMLDAIAAAEPAAGEKPVEPATALLGKIDALMAKLNEVSDLLARLGDEGDDEEESPEGQEEVAEVIPAEQGEDDDEGMDAAAKSAALELVKQVRPAIADIKDTEDRQRVTDALLSLFASPRGGRRGRVASLVAATKGSAQRAADAATRCDLAKQQEIYDARNPHKRK